MKPWWLTFLLLLPPASAAAGGTVEAELSIERATINLTGAPVSAMTVNGGIPGPTLRFTEGDVARIHVHNRMDVETSIHWHGLLVPPGMDGVPNLTFPPIAPRSTFTYEFPIRQSGTYWYHSHTKLQEQLGVYGSIVISPRQGETDPSDRDHVVLLSDWTDTDPHAVLRALRRGSEWYALERGTGQSLFGAARVGRLKDYLARELQRMPAMDIADVAYDRFLANGKSESSLEARGGETVRLRLIDGSATTFFHVEFSGGPMTVISADGIEVEPFEIQRLLIGVAETYDVLIRIPESGSYELRATAHDASGYASVWLGEGNRHPAPTVPYPDLYQSMGGLSAARLFSWTPAGTMGMPDAEVEAGRFDSPGMHMAGHGAMSHGEGHQGTMDHSGHPGHAEGAQETMDHGAHAGHGEEDEDQGTMDHGGHAGHAGEDQGAVGQDSHAGHGKQGQGAMKHGSRAPAATGDGAGPHHSGREPSATAGPPPDSTMETSPYLGPDTGQGGKSFGSSFGWLKADLASRSPLVEDGMGPERPWPPYSRLRARSPTAFDRNKPVREIRLTLDGDMERYVWFLNGRPLSESDEIEIKEGEVARFIMINRTMMHHPMHLHGHFFRVVNGQGDFAPLKHTVNVEPMSTTVIEFDANEKGDWFFHCHLLYHMKSGMARVVSYESFVPPADVQAIRPQLYEEHWFAWGEAEVMSHRTEGSLMMAKTRHWLAAEWEIGWQDVPGTEGEVTLTGNRYVNRFLSYFAGVDLEGNDEETEDPRLVAGLRYLLPLLVESRLWIDSDGEARLVLEKSLHLTPRLALTGEVEFDTEEHWEGQAGFTYTLNHRLDLLANWHSEQGFGGGLAVRF